ncbi:hypothetical protein ACFL3Q_08845 [Planctomycetota bacterium]
MKVTKVVLAIVIGMLLIKTVSSEYDFKLPMVLPFMGGSKPGIYEIGGIVVILIAIWGIGRLGRSDGD